MVVVLKKNDVKRVLEIELIKYMVLVYYVVYILLLIFIIFALLQILIEYFISLPNSRLLEKLDLLLLQKEEQEKQIADLQDQLSLILATIQKPTSAETAFEVLSNNSSLFVGLSAFFISLIVMNFLVRPDLKIFCDKVVESQAKNNDSFVSCTADALDKLSSVFAREMSRIVSSSHSTNLRAFDRDLFHVFSKLDANDTDKVIRILNKLNELALQQAT